MKSSFQPMEVIPTGVTGLHAARRAEEEHRLALGYVPIPHLQMEEKAARD